MKLFVNMLTPDDKYSLSVKVSVKRNQFKPNNLHNPILFLHFFVPFSNLHQISNILKKKDEPHTLQMYFRNYALQKAWLFKCLRRAVSEHLWTVNMLKRPKNC